MHTKNEMRPWSAEVGVAVVNSVLGLSLGELTGPHFGNIMNICFNISMSVSFLFFFSYKTDFLDVFL